jgi:hypothetical protein
MLVDQADEHHPGESACRVKPILHSRQQRELANHLVDLVSGSDDTQRMVETLVFPGADHLAEVSS